MTVLSPLILGLSGVVLLVEGWPALFLQKRPGLRAKPFVLIKFRTMVVGADSTGDEPRTVTRLGSFLRKTSLDELPSLWNIVRGDMSFVGPRPLLEEYLEIYSQNHSRRHAVRPGLTGLAQVAGRNLVSWAERLDIDIVYVNSYSFLLDLRILMRTTRVVLSSQGVNQADGSMMTPLFEGYESSGSDIT